MAIHIGTSGWSYKHWKGEFYPANIATTDFLHYYSSHFKATEINSSFYQLPQKSTIEKWVASVPEDFIFCPKMSRYLTHLKKLYDFEEPLMKFFNRFDIMGRKMGPVLLQLPANLGFKHEIISSLYKHLRDAYPGHRFAIEARHDGWFADDALILARKYNIAMVMAQSIRFPYHEQITADDIYLRLHGPGKLYGSSYTKEDLKTYAKKIAGWNNTGHHVWIFFNNDMYMHAIHDAKALLEML